MYAWSKILLSVDNSKLYLKSKNFYFFFNGYKYFSILFPKYSKCIFLVFFNYDKNDYYNNNIFLALQYPPFVFRISPALNIIININTIGAFCVIGIKVLFCRHFTIRFI